jgi:hypothetical protein
MLGHIDAARALRALQTSMAFEYEKGGWFRASILDVCSGMPRKNPARLKKPEWHAFWEKERRDALEAVIVLRNNGFIEGPNQAALRAAPLGQNHRFRFCKMKPFKVDDLHASQ